jgi:hypothetical protein
MLAEKVFKIYDLPETERDDAWQEHCNLLLRQLTEDQTAKTGLPRACRHKSKLIPCSTAFGKPYPL